MALGARVQDVLMMVGGDATWLIGIGLLLGLSIAAASAHVIEGNLVEVTSTDPVT